MEKCVARKILLITDAWLPQTNGVVTTLSTVVDRLNADGHTVKVIHPGLYRTWPLPTYAEIRIAGNPWRLKPCIGQFLPDCIHIATEGPLGIYARNLLTHLHIPFTTSLHTKFPEYIHSRTRLPLAIGYRMLRWFHQPAVRTLCATESHKVELLQRGFADLVVWGRGVDSDRFRPQPHTPRSKPRLLYVGRVAVEKNLAAFLQLDLDVDKIVVGDGPARSSLEAQYPEVEWLGYRKGEALVQEYAQADVFVFPSRTDTFGLVMLEANACGTPVAAYPVTGPLDVVIAGVNGALHEDLRIAVQQAMEVPREACRIHAQSQSWSRIAQRLVENLAQIDWARLDRSRERLVR